ncbi:unnamed protein product [Calypogeia fissa]
MATSATKMQARGSWSIIVALLFVIALLQVYPSRGDNLAPAPSLIEGPVGGPVPDSGLPLGHCLDNNTCANTTLCCSKSFYCGPTADYCGAGCLSGPCQSSGAEPSSSSGAVAGIAIAAAAGMIIYQSKWATAEFHHTGN